jgi:LacI family transcriptional regulator
MKMKAITNNTQGKRQMKSASRVTQKLIAERTGLSIATIDRALNNRGNVKPDTYRKIMEATKELNYTINKSASLLARKEEINIAVVLLVYPTFFWEQIEKSIWNAYSELRDFGLNIEIIRINDDPEESLATVQDILNSGKFDALALPAGPDAYIDVIDKSIDSGFPVCTFNIDSPSSKRLFYVGCNYSSAGKLAGELLCKLIGGSGKVALITDSWISFQSQQKISGFREVLTEFPNVKLIGPLKMERDNVQDSLSALEDELRFVDGIYVSNAELESIAELKLRVNKSAVLVGHDMNKGIYHHLNTGTVTATICQDPASQGYLTVKKLFNYLALKEEINIRENITKLEIVMKENAKFYI